MEERSIDGFLCSDRLTNGGAADILQDQLTIPELVTCQQQHRSWLGALMPRRFRLSRKTSLKTRYSALSGIRSRLLVVVRNRTPEKMDSIGLLVRRCTQCSSGKS